MSLTIPETRLNAAKMELDQLIKQWLDEYLARTPMARVPPPRWKWTPEWSAIHYHITDQTIYINEYYAKGYILSPNKAKRVLRWSLAHEFWHYIQHVHGGPLGFPILDFSRVAEVLAEKHAVLLSGISNPEGDALTVEIVDLVMFFEQAEYAWR